MIETVVHVVHELRTELNITHYELFDLRDAENAHANNLDAFGLLHANYTPKLAFETYRRLIAELG